MNGNIEIEVTLFGPFRKYGSGIKLSVPLETTLHELRPLLASELRKSYPYFREEGLLYKSAIADEKEILKDDSKVTGRLAVLPPVCGG